MKCLRCESQELEPTTHGTGPDEIEIDKCPSCGGMWLDSHELKQMDDSLSIDLEEVPYTSIAPTAADEALHCPRCEGAPVLKKAYPAGYQEVVVDTCRQCKGFWLDRDELRKMREVSDRLLLKSLDED